MGIDEKLTFLKEFAMWYFDFYFSSKYNKN